MKKIFQELIILQRNIPALFFASFAVAIVMMNLLANKSLNTNSQWIAADCGFLFSWIVFFVMDVVTKNFGLRAANLLSILGLVINLFMVLLLVLASYIPGTWSGSYTDNGVDLHINQIFDETFRGSWYILTGSSIAFVSSAFLNNFLNYRIGNALKKDNFASFFTRIFFSTFVGQFFDNLVFALIVSIKLFGWTIEQAIICALIGSFLELIFEIIFSPFAYRISRRWQEDNIGAEYLNIYAH